MIKAYLLMHKDAKNELLGYLNGSSRKNQNNAALIDVLLRELGSNELLFTRLINYGLVSYTDILGNAVPFAAVRQLGGNVWRLKVYKEPDHPPLRVIYAYIQKPQKYYVLAVVERKYYNYELTDPITIRIRAVYERLLADFG